VSAFYDSEDVNWEDHVETIAETLGLICAVTHTRKSGSSKSTIARVRKLDGEECSVWNNLIRQGGPLLQHDNNPRVPRAGNRGINVGDE
jgi:hypothetical protein